MATTEDNILALDNVEPALLFGLLDAQLRRDPKNQDGTQTSDNARIDLWPIDITNDRFALQTGSYARKLYGGLQRSDSTCRIPTPLDTPTGSFGVRPDDDLATDCYSHLCQDSVESQQFGTALRWTAMAWRNDRSITVEDRVIGLRVAFEAIHSLRRRLVTRDTVALFRSVSSTVAIACSPME